jgi:plasmid stability protein
MKRTMVQFDDETYRRLREQAFRQQRSMSALVRELVAQGLEGGVRRERPTDVRQLKFVAVGRSRQGRLSPVSERHDEALAAALKK